MVAGSGNGFPFDLLCCLLKKKNQTEVDACDFYTHMLAYIYACFIRFSPIITM